METWLIVIGVCLAIVLIAGFAIWRGNKSASDAGAATAAAAQATAEATADRAALGAAVQEVKDEDVVKSLRAGTF